MNEGLAKEAHEASLDGATLVKNSGRGMFKCDALLGIFGIDYKHAEKSFTLNTTIWAKVVKDAWKNGGRAPAIKVVFKNNGIPLRLWIISDEEMKEYLRLLEAENGTE